MDYKKVDGSFCIVERLEPEKYEIWYVSYNASPKEGYRCDKFLREVPYEETPKVYGIAGVYRSLLREGKESI